MTYECVASEHSVPLGLEGRSKFNLPQGQESRGGDGGEGLGAGAWRHGVGKTRLVLGLDEVLQDLKHILPRSRYGPVADASPPS
jgi:hypothetical protein